MAASLDEISDGRFVLGLGAGWSELEYRAFGYPFEHLASRFEEALQIIVPGLAPGTGRLRGEVLSGARGSAAPAWSLALRPAGATGKTYSASAFSTY